MNTDQLSDEFDLIFGVTELVFRDQNLTDRDIQIRLDFLFNLCIDYITEFEYRENKSVDLPQFWYPH